MFAPEPIALVRKSSENAEQLPQAEGSVIADRYSLGAVAGYGATSVVYAATDTRLGRPVAVKVLRRELARDSALSKRFANEAIVTAGLENPHVVRVYDRGLLPSGEPFMVMEWLDGMSLAQVLAQRGPLPVAEAVDLVIDACVGLAEAHAMGIVHRDVKPANLISCRGPDGKQLLKIVDFGISKRIPSDPTLTLAGTSVGSPCYMSPEQAMGSVDIDARSDVWSLGVVLFELLTGRLPFDGGSIAEVFAAILAEPTPSLRVFRGDVDGSLEAVVCRCLAKEPARRFRDADALRQALTLHGSGGLHLADADSWSTTDEQVDPPPKSSSRLEWLGLGLAFSVVLLGVWSVTGRSWSVGDVVLDSAAVDLEPPLVAFTPRLDLPRGVYAERAAHGTTGPELRAEPELSLGTSQADEDGYEDFLEPQGVPVNRIWVRERRIYRDGVLIGVESELVESPDSDEPPQTGEEPHDEP